MDTLGGSGYTWGTAGPTCQGCDSGRGGTEEEAGCLAAARGLCSGPPLAAGDGAAGGVSDENRKFCFHTLTGGSVGHRHPERLVTVSPSPPLPHSRSLLVSYPAPFFHDSYHLFMFIIWATHQGCKRQGLCLFTLEALVPNSWSGLLQCRGRE